jgi:hypothetical protein
MSGNNREIGSNIKGMTGHGLNCARGMTKWTKLRDHRSMDCGILGVCMDDVKKVRNAPTKGKKGFFARK